MASASTRRPSASVLPTSTVVPARDCRTSPGRKALPAMLFSAAGIRMRNRTSSLFPMIMWPSASAVAAPPMSFFISSMPLDGLMSRPPVSKQMPLPTSVTAGAPVAAPGEVDQPRRARARAADGMDQREVLGEQIVALDHGDARAVARGKVARRRLELGGAQVGGRRVDEVAPQPDRLDRAHQRRRGRRHRGCATAAAPSRAGPCSGRSDRRRGPRPPPPAPDRAAATRAGRTPAGSDCASWPISSSEGPLGSPQAPSPAPNSTPASRPSAPGSSACCLASPLKPDASIQLRCAASSGTAARRRPLADKPDRHFASPERCRSERRLRGVGCATCGFVRSLL